MKYKSIAIILFKLNFVSVSSAAVDSLRVYFFLLDECMISIQSTPEIMRVIEEHKDHVDFEMVFPSEATSTQDAEAFMKTYLEHQKTPIIDHNQTLARPFGITIMPEVAVLDLSTNRLIYRGRIHDLYAAIGQRKAKVQDFTLDVFLDRCRSSIPDTVVTTQAVGCYLNQITFEK